MYTRLNNAFDRWERTHNVRDERVKTASKRMIGLSRTGKIFGNAQKKTGGREDGFPSAMLSKGGHDEIVFPSSLYACQGKGDVRLLSRNRVPSRFFIQIYRDRWQTCSCHRIVRLTIKPRHYSSQWLRPKKTNNPGRPHKTGGRENPTNTVFVQFMKVTTKL